MSNPPFLAPLEFWADELFIRAYRPGDGGALQRATVSSYEHLRPWMPWAKPEQSVEEAEALCRRFAGKYLLGEDFVLGAWSGDELVGGTGYHLRWGGVETGNAEIGMWISAASAGQGFGTRLLDALLEWGFTTWPWQRLVWRCDVQNRASVRVAEKNGLRLEGTFRADDFTVDGSRRDTHHYAILRDEWLAR